MLPREPFMREKYTNELSEFDLINFSTGSRPHNINCMDTREDDPCGHLIKYVNACRLKYGVFFRNKCSEYSDDYKKCTYVTKLEEEKKKAKERRKEELLIEMRKEEYKKKYYASKEYMKTKKQTDGETI